MEPSVPPHLRRDGLGLPACVRSQKFHGSLPSCLHHFAKLSLSWVTTNLQHLCRSILPATYQVSHLYKVRLLHSLWTGTCRKVGETVMVRLVFTSSFPSNRTLDFIRVTQCPAQALPFPAHLAVRRGQGSAH